MGLALKLGEPFDLPEAGELDHLWDAFIDAGMTLETGMGDTTLTWGEIQSFATATGSVSESWELRALRRMSAAYLRARHAGEEFLAMSPVEQLREQVRENAGDPSEMTPLDMIDFIRGDLD